MLILNPSRYKRKGTRDAAEIIAENNEKGCSCTTILKTFCIFALSDTK